MNPADMALPTVKSETFALSGALERILRLQWAVDPPYLRGLREDIAKLVAQAHLRYQADSARFEAQAANRYADFMQEIVTLTAKGL